MDAATQLTSALAGRYDLAREIGRGGMATVYLAHDRKHDRDVAIKVLDPDLAAPLGAERFLREIKLVAQLQHPHILPLYDSGESDGLLFYVMPFLSGDSLRARLARERTLPLDDALRIAAEVAEALDYAHRHGVVHRDIKPENILFQDEQAIVADFGVARVSTAATSTTLTHTGIAVGTVAYMSPEQAAGERDVDGRADVYSLGCVLFEMIAGEPPFTGPTAQAVMAKRFAEAPPPVRTVRSAVPEAIEQLILRAMAREPADRCPSASQLSAFIRAAAAKPDAPRAPSVPPVHPQAAARRDEAIDALRRADLELATTEACVLAIRAARAAIELEPSLGEAHSALGLAFAFTWQWADAEREARRGVELAPRSVLSQHWFALVSCALGRFNDARTALDRAIEIDQSNVALHLARGAVDYYARDVDAAIRGFRIAIAADPTGANARVLLGLALAARGALDDALTEFERSLDLAGEVQPFALTATCVALASAGRRTDALTARGELEALSRRADISPFYLAAAATALGDHAAALDALRRAVDRRDTWLLSIKSHPWLDPLRREPAFADIVASVGL